MTSYPLAPVIVFAYRRPEKTRQIMDALAQNHLASQTEVFVYSNAPVYMPENTAIDDDRADVFEVRSIHKKYDRCFKRYTITERETNTGPNDNMIPAINEILAQYDSVIVLEDDILTAKNFLDYMNQALIHYRDSENVFSICAYNPAACDEPQNSDTFLYGAFRSWGWAIWRDRWEKVRLSPGAIMDMTLNIDFIYVHTYALVYYTTLRHQLLFGYNSEFRYLDWLIAINQLYLNKQTVYPFSSYCDNIGLDGGGQTTPIAVSYSNESFDITGKKREFSFSGNDFDKLCSRSYFYKFRELEFAMPVYRPIHYTRGDCYMCMYYAISQLYSKGVGTTAFFESRNIKKVALYGIGQSGKLFYDMLLEAGVEIVYGFDISGIKQYKSLIIESEFHRIPQLPPVDAIIVTPINLFHEIEETLELHTDIPVICAEDIIYESLKDCLRGE